MVIYHSYVSLPEGTFYICLIIFSYLLKIATTPNLLGGAITILKNDGVRQWEGWHPIYEMEVIKAMFETTNQQLLLQTWSTIAPTLNPQRSWSPGASILHPSPHRRAELIGRPSQSLPWRGRFCSTGYGSKLEPDLCRSWRRSTPMEVVKIRETATAIYLDNLDTREKQSSHLQDPRGPWGRCWCCVNPRLYNWETSVKRFSDVSLSLGFAQWGHQFGIFSQPSFFTRLDSEAGKRTHSITWWIGDILPNKCWVPFPSLVSVKKLVDLPK